MLKQAYELLDGSSSHNMMDESVSSIQVDSPQTSRNSWVEFATFSWLNEIIAISQDRVLCEEDITPLPSSCGALCNRRMLEGTWSRSKTEIHRKGLAASLLSIYGWRYAAIGVYLLLSTLALFIGPLLLKELVDQAVEGLDNGDQQIYALKLVIFLFVSKILASIFSTQYSYQCGILAVCVGSAIRGNLFGKLILLSTESRRQFAAGSISNLYTTDVSRITDLVLQLHRFWALPLQIAVAMGLLYMCVGIAVFAGLLAITGILVINHVISTLIKKATDKVQKCKDVRMEHISSWLNSSLVIKLNGWEDETKKVVLEAREAELVSIWTVLLISAVNICLLWLAPCIVSVSTITSYALIEEELSAARIFTAVSLFKSLQDPFRDLPGIITQYFQAMSSIERLDNFMEAVEAERHGQRLTIENISFMSERQPQIEMQHMVTAGQIVISKDLRLSWTDSNVSMHENAIPLELEQSSKQALHINPAAINPNTSKNFFLNLKQISIKPSELIVIQGRTGSGKSSFLHALLGNMYPSNKSDVEVSGSVAYAGQQAFILSGTIKHNIVMGNIFNKDRFEKVLRACSLSDDLKRFAHGVDEIIGEKGVGLSGGQKARVALARVVYADASIVLLDDVFAALDSKVSRRVFQDVVLKLLQSKTRIIVTHSTEILHHPAVNRRLTIQDGFVTVETLRDIKPDFEPISIDDLEVEDVDIMMESDKALEPEDTESISDMRPDIRKNHSYQYLTVSNTNEIGKNRKEDRATGEIDLEVYRGYVKEMGGMRTIFFLCCIQVWWQILSVGSDLFLSRWTSENDGEQKSNCSLILHFILYCLLGVG